MANFEDNILLNLKRRYSPVEQYNLLLSAYTRLQRETKSDTENLRLLRKEYQEMEQENKKLKEQLSGRGVVSTKIYSKLLKKHRDLEAKHYDLIREWHKAPASKELEDLRM